MSAEAGVAKAVRKTRPLLRPYERRTLHKEAIGVSRDVTAIFGSLFTAFNFAQLVGYEFKIAPLEFLLYHWQIWTEWFWSKLLFAYPYRFNAPALTYVLVMCCMFLRGRYGRYASFRNFTPQTQTLLLRVIYWLLALTLMVATLVEHGATLLATPVKILVTAVGFPLVFAIGYGFLSLYAWFLKKTRLLLYCVRHPYLVFIFLLGQFGLDFLMRTHEASRRAESGIAAAADTLDLGGGAFALLGMSLWIGILPFAFWYIRVFLAVFVSIVSLFAIDMAWGLLTS